MRSRIVVAFSSLASILFAGAAFAEGVVIDPYGSQGAYVMPPPPPPPSYYYAQPPAQPQQQALPQQQTQAGTVIINIQQAPGSTQQVAPAQPMNPYGPGYYYPPPGYAAPIYSYPPPNHQRYRPAPGPRGLP